MLARQAYSAFFTMYSAFEMVGGAGNAPVVTSDVYFATPDLQAGSRNTSQESYEFSELLNQ